MKSVVQGRAIELGFDACRFTAAAPPASTAHFDRWIAEGRHGEMAYLARNAPKRRDPQLVLPGASTVVTLAVSYHQPPVSCAVGPSPARSDRPVAAACGSNSDAVGEVARYARFADYHDVLREPLDHLAGFLNQLGGSGTRSLWYTDTGPVLERDLAQRAGLGFAGKHTSLISRHLGNWFFLAEILTTLHLEPDPPEHNRCGTCVRCLSACPTGAITAPFELDARRCISYLTIELKGSIPIELRPYLGNRIFGCDDCLAVCPWNRFAREGALLRGQFREDLLAPSLIGLLSLDEAGFKLRFAGTPPLACQTPGPLAECLRGAGKHSGPRRAAGLGTGGS